MEPKMKKSPKRAVALRYQADQDQAPKVTAKGSGYVAEKIIRLAKEHHVPIQEDPDLVQVLSQLDLEQEIPPSVYKVVAEILAFVYSVNDRHRTLRKEAR
jgi:flagellar biosynthesis protein